MTDKRIRVLIADRQVLYRGALATALRARAGFEVVAETGNAPQTIVELARLVPDVVLVDMELPGGATRVIEWASTSLDTCRVLAIAEQQDEAFITQILNAGAGGYLSRTCTDTELVDGVRAMDRGEFVMPVGMLSTVLRRLTVGARDNIIGQLRANDELRLETDALIDSRDRVVVLDENVLHRSTAADRTGL